MENYILKTMKDEKKGLYLYELPTGYGKTRNAAKAMKAYAESSNHKRKIIYLTTLNKNLPEKELLDAYDGDEAEYKKHVLRIRSNRDEVTEKIETLRIPEEYKTDTYSKLLDLVRKYAASKKAQDLDYKKSIEDRLDKAEREFRKEIEKSLKKSFPNKQEKLHAIETKPNWKWIGELYPAVFTDQYEILIMSISKFMKRNSCLVEPSYEFLKSDMIENAIIFIDEFDATKASIQEEIIETALSVREEYL